MFVVGASFFSSEITRNSLSAWLRPDPLGELTALLRLPSWINGPTSDPAAKTRYPLWQRPRSICRPIRHCDVEPTSFACRPIAGRRRSDASHLRRHDVGPICRADAALHRPDIQPPLVIFIRIKVQHKVTAIIE